MSALDAIKRIDRRRILRVAGLFVLAAAILVLVDSAQQLAGSTLNAQRLYRYAITSGFRDQTADNTAVVLIQSGVEPRQVTFSNVCQQRAFLGRLFQAILAQPKKTARPAVIVIDKFSAPDSCLSPDELASTDELLTAVSQLVEAGIPVVVGQTFSGKQAADGTDVLEPIVFTPQSGVTPGSIVFEEDPRRVVFGWNAVRPDGTKAWIDTLSFAATLAYKPGILEQKPRLRAFHDANDAPFVKFMTRDEFAPFSFSAIELLCGKGAGTDARWRDCSQPDAAGLAKLGHRVVLIGEDSFGMDQHETVAGWMPGVFVHANYVEAFLHDDLYKGTPWILAVALAFVVCIIVELIAAYIKPLVPRIVVVAMFLGAAYAACIFMVRLSGYFIDPAFGLVAAVAGQIADGVRHIRSAALEPGRRFAKVESTQ